ncbi:hypothetical protein ACFSTC_18900 [Nonomuraea ferruginea]
MTATTTRPEPAARDRSARNLVDLVFRARELSLVLALAALVGGTAAVNPNFLSGQGVEDILLNTAILALLAVGQSMVVITRNLDLSVGSVVGLVAFVVGDALASGWGSCRASCSASPSAPPAACSTGCWSASAGCRPWS